MHRECGFIRLKPDTNKVAFVSAQNTGMVPLLASVQQSSQVALKCVSAHGYVVGTVKIPVLQRPQPSSSLSLSFGILPVPA